MIKKLLPLALLAFVATAQADEAEVRKAMESKLGAKVESVTKSGYLGLYEVYMEGNIFYTDEKMTAFIAGGQLIDAKTMKNATEERMRKLTAIKFSELPLDRAIKQVRGNGKRVLATFEDPNCGYSPKIRSKSRARSGAPVIAQKPGMTGCWMARCRAARRIAIPQRSIKIVSLPVS